MSKIKKVKAVKPVKKPTATVGRKRDETLDGQIIEAAINILAEVGFDSMTMDMVAAKVGAGKASLYRRWKSKAELVRDALIFMSRNSVDLENVPNTGNLRSDLLSLLKPYSAEYGERKLKVLAKLGSFFSDHRKLAEESTAGIFGPMTEMNLKIMKQAIERKEISKKADIELACQVIIAMIAHRTLNENKGFDKTTYSALLDNILLPALKNC